MLPQHTVAGSVANPPRATGRAGSIRALALWLSLASAVGVKSAPAAPAPPQPVQSQPGDTVAELSWKPPPHLRVKGYRVFRDGSARPVHGDELLAAPRLTDIGLTNGREYRYDVTAVLHDGSEWKGFAPARVTLPAAGRPTPTAVPQVAANPTARVGESGAAVQPAADNFRVDVLDDPQPPYLCRLLDAATRKEVARVEDGTLLSALPTGRYVLGLTQYRFEGQEVVFPRVIDYRAGEKLKLEVSTSVRINKPDSVGPLYAWKAVRADRPKEVVQWHYGSHPVMLLPPGEYQVVLIQPVQFGSQDLPWPGKVGLKEGRQVTVGLDSGVVLDMPKEAGPLHAWDVARGEKGDQRVQWHYANQRVMLVPPGEYRVAVQPVQYSSERLVWPEPVTVKQGELTKVTLDSGVRIELAKEVGALHTWSVVRADKPAERLQWHSGDQKTMLVPPGEYHVAIHPIQFNSETLPWQPKVQVRKGEYPTVKLTSGITLDMPKEAGPLHTWDVAQAGKPDQRLQWHPGDRRTMLLPPGEYRVAVQPVQYSSERLVWPKSVTVKEGQWAPARLASSVRLELPKEAELHHWEVVRPDNAVKRLQWQPGDQRVMLIPPGEYRVAIQPVQFTSERLVWPAKVEVQEGKQAVVTIAGGVQLVGPKGAAPAFDFRILPADGKEPVQSGSQTWAPQLLPPGVYKIEVRANQGAPWKVLADKVVVEDRKLTKVEMPSLPVN